MFRHPRKTTNRASRRQRAFPTYQTGRIGRAWMTAGEHSTRLFAFFTLARDPMQYALEHFGVGVAAITGVLAARGKQVDLFGVIVLALVTAFGGGTLRDLLVGDRPLFWIRDPNFLLNAFAVALVTFFAARFHEFPQSVLLVADAFALALFTAIGVRKGLAFDVAPSIAVAMGIITGVAGGMMRDVLTGEIPLVFRRDIYLYATAALCGASVFVLLQKWFLAEQVNMVIAAGVTLLLRLAAIRWKLGLPVFRHRSDSNL